MASIATDIKNTTKLLGKDLIIAYGLSHIHQHVADDVHRLMGPTGSGKSNVRDMMSYTISYVLTSLKDYRHHYQPTWQACRFSIGVMHD